MTLGTLQNTCEGVRTGRFFARATVRKFPGKCVQSAATKTAHPCDGHCHMVSGVCVSIRRLPRNF